jgi:ferredoxin
MLGRADLDVDAVTGATVVSYGTINATRDAVWKGVVDAPKLSPISKVTLWFTSLRFQRVTIHSLAVLFIVVLLFDYTIQAALVEGTGQSLNCMDCQTCVGACPVKRAEGKLFPMEMVLRARLGDYETVARLMQYCVGCSKCAAKCPAGISAPSVAAAVAQYLRKQKREEAEFFEERA